MLSSSSGPVHAGFSSQVSETHSDKISAYYSLVFPNITYYLQTLSVTIGRRCLPLTMPSAGTSIDSPQTQVDVDLGPLKSVSRLHAKIEWHEEQERFVLVVIGRNGAWVDGVWSGSGSKVPLNENSQIQIASRTFHFVLPPAPQPPLDSPSPSSQSSGPLHTSARSPSVDVTSLSPATSEHTPPPPAQHRKSISPKPKSAQAHKRKSTPPASRKRKKQDRKPTPPAQMPPKPPYTYSQLCYRAIKAMDGKATLQDICRWMENTFDWYRYNGTSGWENSVRHNLSSNSAFKKMERCAGERGKGFFWSVDPNFEHMFNDTPGGGNGGGKLNAGFSGKKKAASGGTPLEPPLKRGVKGVKGGVLPPPMTTAPLAMKGLTLNPPNPFTSTTQQTMMSGVSDSQPTTAAPAQPPVASRPSVPPGQLTAPAADGVATTSTTATAAASIPSLPRIPLVVAPLPPSFKSTPASSTGTSATTNATTNATSNTQPNPHESLVLHEGKLYLHPTIFADLSPAHLRALEALGVQKAIEVLKGHIVSYLREVGRREGRGKGKVRGRGRRRGAGTNASPAASAAGRAPNEGEEQQVRVDGDEKEEDEKAGEAQRAAAAAIGAEARSGGQAGGEPAVPPTPSAVEERGERDVSPIIVVDDDEQDQRSLKRRRVGSEGSATAACGEQMVVDSPAPVGGICAADG